MARRVRRSGHVWRSHPGQGGQALPQGPGAGVWRARPCQSSGAGRRRQASSGHRPNRLRERASERGRARLSGARGAAACIGRVAGRVLSRRERRRDWPRRLRNQLQPLLLQVCPAAQTRRDRRRAAGDAHRRGGRGARPRLHQRPGLPQLPRLPQLVLRPQRPHQLRLPRPQAARPPVLCSFSWKGTPKARS